MSYTAIDSMILMRQSTVLGGLAYMLMINEQSQIDAAIMSTRLGAKHSRNPMHYKYTGFNNGH